MEDIYWGLIIGSPAGLVLGMLLAASIMCCIRPQKRSPRRAKCCNPTDTMFSIQVNGVNPCTAVSDSTAGQETPRTSEWSNMPQWLEGLKRKSIASVCGIPKYSFKDLQKATSDFSTMIGKGSFGSVYKAQMPAGETVAVKVLDSDSRQGEVEFLTEVLLLGRLHHKNLVNLVGYGAEKGQNMLVYVYMSNGCLSSHLYEENREPLSWDTRCQIALDVARGLEYLHYGAVPPVVHRDVKSSNILLDGSMRARVSDFGLSRQEMVVPHSTQVKGTYGYLDPEYMMTKTFTKKSDVYSFGVLLYELVSGRNPQLGLMQYVDLAAIDVASAGWGEIADTRLNGSFNLEELNALAALAYKCINPVSRMRPTMRDVVQEISWTFKQKHRRRLSFPVTAEEPCFELDLQHCQDSSLTER